MTDNSLIMKKTLLVVFILIILGAGGYLVYANFLKPKPKAVHFHAGFHVYVDGKLFNFTDEKYMKFEPCTTKNAKVVEDDQEEKAHLHDFIGDVVHVHRSNAVWGDLFKNIKFPVDKPKPMTAYINGKEVDNILDYPIKSYDSLVLLLGKHGNVADYIKNEVKKDHILKVEKMSETCGSGS